MPVTYSEFCQIFKKMRHIENPDMTRKVYSAIFRHIQGHSPTFSHVQAY